MRSIFLHDPADLDADIAGGVQLCSRQFLAIVRAASQETRLAAVQVTRRPGWRLRRRLGLGSYLYYHPEEARSALSATVTGYEPTHFFLNRCELLRLAPLCRQLAPQAKIVAMSHGNKSGDDLYEISGPGGRAQGPFAALRAIWQLGLDLVTESRARHRDLDAICVMSSEEEVLERWLGAHRTIILPRIVQSKPLAWQPVRGRVGFVGTLDHTPNRIALERLCDCLRSLAPAGVELRVAGGPTEVGRALSKRCPSVHYLGRLDDATLAQEASTWSLFLNPIFWLSRGASMKLGQALSWGIPPLTTKSGARGYALVSGQTLQTGDDVEDFTRQMIAHLQNEAELVAVRERLIHQVNDWPDTTTLAQRLRTSLG